MNFHRFLSFLMLLAVLMGACTPAAIVEPTLTASPVPPTATLTPVPPTDTPVPTATPTPTLAPTETPTLTPEPTATKTVREKLKTNIVYIMLLPNTGGGEGCKNNETTVPIYTEFLRTGNLIFDASRALRFLFAAKVKTLGPYINGMWDTALYITKVEYDPPPHETLIVSLDGRLTVTNMTVCDAQRIHDQIWGTLRWYHKTGDLTIRYTDNFLIDILSRPHKKK